MFCIELTAVVDGENIPFNYSIIISARDVCEYYFEQKYQKEFNPLTWYLEDGAKDYITYIEDKWLKNNIDELKLYNDLSFKYFICKKYEVEICNKALSIVAEEAYFKDDECDEDESFVDIYLEGQILYAASY